MNRLKMVISALVFFSAMVASIRYPGHEFTAAAAEAGTIYIGVKAYVQLQGPEAAKNARFFGTAAAAYAFYMCIMSSFP